MRSWKKQLRRKVRSETGVGEWECKRGKERRKEAAGGKQREDDRSDTGRGEAAWREGTAMVR